MTAPARTWHTGLVVSDLDRTARWFRDVLGFTLTDEVRPADALITGITGVEQPALRMVFAQGPDHMVELLEFSGAPRAPLATEVARTGTAHLALFVDDLDAVLAASLPWGRRPIRPPVAIDTGPRAGWRICYTIDDDGIVVELAQRPVG